MNGSYRIFSLLLLLISDFGSGCPILLRAAAEKALSPKPHPLMLTSPPAVQSAVVALGEELDREGSSDGRSTIRAFDLGFLQEILFRSGRDPLNQVLLSRNGKVEGFLVVEHIASSRGIQVHKLGVRARYQGQKFATRMLRNLATHALDREVDRIFLFVFEENAGAIRLYRRLGFEYDFSRASARPPALISRYSVPVSLLQERCVRSLGESNVSQRVDQPLWRRMLMGFLR